MIWALPSMWRAEHRGASRWMYCPFTEQDREMSVGIRGDTLALPLAPAVRRLAYVL